MIFFLLLFFFLNKINLPIQFIVVIYCLAGVTLAANVPQRIKIQLYLISKMVLGVARQQPKNVFGIQQMQDYSPSEITNTYFRSLKIQFFGKVFSS